MIQSRGPLFSFLLYLILFAISNIYMYNGFTGQITYYGEIRYLFALIISIYLFILFIRKLTKQINHYVLLYLLLLSYILIYITTNTILYPFNDINITDKLFTYNLFIIFWFTVFFLMGYFYEGYEVYKKIIFISFFLLTLNVFLNFDFRNFMIDISKLSGENRGIYLFLGDSYAAFAILAIAICQSKKIRGFLIIASLFTSYALVSRTSFYALIVTIIILLAKKRKENLYFLIFILIFLILVLFINKDIISILTDSRMFSFLATGEDASVEGRKIDLTIGLKDIFENPIIGTYGGDYLYFNKLGSYIHNYLELLRQYGIIPFLIVVYFSYQLLKKIILWFFEKKEFISDYDFFILISLFFLIESISSRSINYPYLFFSIGILSSSNIFKRSI